MSNKLITNITNAGLFLFCIVYLIYSFRISFGSAGMPGPGFLPTTLGVIGTLLSFGFLVKGFFIKKIEKLEDFTKRGILRFAGYVLSIVIFLLTYKTIGIIMLFLLIVSLAKISGLRRWISSILFAGIFTTIVYFLFTFLQIPFPSGIF
ncbi:tripartite tricarboxylate transporter TctB family protein [Neobacillus mesonae]|uniref:tripartite tricarboxylate transporter TctB family protein n=1 Tax=Neobacillus mesonae TaxID=1193713 RepID=UPI00203C3BEA|nr:tripartite tricarboxylate transporter TctB family protein [Neobacillus mesonae]MCM3569404.1 tripartite tricarboxylate transporter TctB family protein [Neobacillus mesonae]